LLIRVGLRAGKSRNPTRSITNISRACGTDLGSKL
jgi:hypothetical protein